MNLSIQTSGPTTAPTIVFLHGFGVSRWMWHDQIEALKEHYHCLAIDLPGNGESYQTEWHSLADTADQVAEVIQTHAHNGRAHVVGLSLGGYVTLHLISRHPNLVRSALISGVTPSPLMRPRLMIAFSKVMSRVMKWSITATLSAKAMQLPDEIIPLYRRDISYLTKETIERVYAEVAVFELPPIENELSSQLLITAGDKEAQAILTGLDTFAHAFPTATITQAPNAHHAWNGEHPELFTQQIRAWMEGAPLPTTLKIVQAPTRQTVF